MAENRLTGADAVAPVTGTAPDKKLSAASPGEMVSVIIPCCGMIEYTKMCVPSVLRYTRKPFELIFLDIGSLDGTAEYLAGIKAASTIRVEIVRTPADLGIADACKEATPTTKDLTGSRTKIISARKRFTTIVRDSTVRGTR